MADLYWKYPFRSLAGAKQMIEFAVLDISPLNVSHGKVRGRGVDPFSELFL